MSPRPPGWAPPLAMWVSLQVGWFACVWGTASGHPGLGPAVVAALLALQLSASRKRGSDLLAGLLVGAGGWLADSLLAAAGLIDFAPAATGPGLAAGVHLAPPWIAALWLHFGASRRIALARLRDWPIWRLALLGALGAPLSYEAGARLGAAAFHPQWWPTALGLALEWGVALPLLVRAFRPAPSAGPGTGDGRGGGRIDEIGRGTLIPLLAVVRPHRGPALPRR